MDVTDDLAGKDINIKAFQVPVINNDLMENNTKPGATLEELFAKTKQALIKRISEVLD